MYRRGASKPDIRPCASRVTLVCFRAETEGDSKSKFHLTLHVAMEKNLTAEALIS